MIKYLSIIFFICASSIADDDFGDLFADEPVQVKEESTVFYCEKSADNFTIKIPIDINHNGNFTSCLSSKIEKQQEYDSLDIRLHQAEMYIPKRDGVRTSKYANCNCLPKNKLDEFLLSDYGSKAAQKEKNKLKEKLKVAYISNMRNTFLDIMDLEVFLNQNGKKVEDNLLVQLKNCSASQYKKNIGFIIKEKCKGQKIDVEKELKEILPDYLEEKMVSFLKGEPMKNSCMNYQTYKNTQMASEYKTLYSLLSNSYSSFGNMDEFKLKSIDRTYEEEYGAYSEVGRFEEKIAGSFLVRYYLNNKEKFDHLSQKYFGQNILPSKHLKDFAKEINDIILKEENINKIAEAVARKCNMGIHEGVIKAAFCPNDSDIPNSLTNSLPENNAFKIEKHCKVSEVEEDDFGVSLGSSNSINGDDKKKENFFDPTSNYFTSKNALNRATKVNKDVNEVLCQGQESAKESIKLKKAEAIRKNLEHVGLSYGVCFKSQEECQKHGYKEEKYSNDPNTLEKFCIVTTEPDCEKKLDYIEKYINNDETLPERVKGFITSALERYQELPAIDVGKGLKQNAHPSALVYDEVERSLDLIVDSSSISSGSTGTQTQVASTTDAQAQSSSGTNSTDLKEASAIEIFANTGKNQSSVLADYALRGDESDYQTIERHEKDPISSKESIYTRKIPVPVVETKLTNTNPIAPQTTSVANENLVTEPSTIQEQDRVVENTKISPAPKVKSSSNVVNSSLPIPEISSSTHTSQEKIIREIGTRSSSEQPSRKVTSANDDSSEVKKLESSIDEIKKLQEQLEREEMDKMSSSPSSSATQSRIEESRRRIEELSRETNEVASRAIESANSASREIDRASNRIANSNNWTSATNISDNNTEINQSVAPISTLDNVDAQAEKIAEDIKKGIGDSELGGEGASGSGTGTRSPASTGGGGGGSAGALGGGLSAGMGGKGRLASNWIDKITFDETQFKKIIEDSYFQNESNKEDLLKALGVMGFKVLTIEENKLNSKDIEYIIREYDLELSENLKKFFGVNDLNSIKNREIVNKKFVEILKDEVKYKEIIAEMMEKFIVKDEKRFSDEGKGLAYKGSVITKNEISESIKKFYAL